MKTSHRALDIGVGLLAGLAATKVTEYAQQALRTATPPDTRRQEQRVRPGSPFPSSCLNGSRSRWLDKLVLGFSAPTGVFLRLSTSAASPRRGSEHQT